MALTGFDKALLPLSFVNSNGTHLKSFGLGRSSANSEESGFFFLRQCCPNDRRWHNHDVLPGAEIGRLSAGLQAPKQRLWLPVPGSLAAGPGCREGLGNRLVRFRPGPERDSRESPLTIFLREISTLFPVQMWAPSEIPVARTIRAPPTPYLAAARLRS